MTTVYDFTVKDNRGNEIRLSDYRDKVILIVNTASKCGFTPQYKGLEELYLRYKDQGLVILGFPCDQFGHQEPGNDSEIASFCELNYGVSFPIMSKIEVNGKNAHPLFGYLKKQAGGWFCNAIKWNFTKFLIARDGKVVDRFSPITKPEQLASKIEALL